MILTTTPTIEGRTIVEYKGVIFGEVIVGVNFLKDFAASIRDLIGGRSNTYEQELVEARQTAMEELKARAIAMGADAVVGIDIDYEVLGQNGGMLMVTASGTAVKLGY
ncbi:MAG: heavy metal-binding domain-containing protein [Alistipes sp.]|nr:heavy metal-binding domain-containing protein [Alistipes sp.]